jgi:hypothetical protein
MAKSGHGGRPMALDEGEHIFLKWRLSPGLCINRCMQLFIALFISFSITKNYIIDRTRLHIRQEFKHKFHQLGQHVKRKILMYDIFYIKHN